jgi:hypothetical protein
VKYLTNILLPNNMNTSKVPIEFPISVSQEIQRFQQDINKVSAENLNFHGWKKERLGLNVNSESFICLKNSRMDSPPDLPPKRTPGSQESIKAPQLPPKSNTGMEKKESLNLLWKELRKSNPNLILFKPSY